MQHDVGVKADLEVARPVEVSVPVRVAPVAEVVAPANVTHQLRDRAPPRAQVGDCVYTITNGNICQNTC